MCLSIVKSSQWDPEKHSLSPSVLKGVDAVINLAGEGIADGRWTLERKRALIQSRVAIGSSINRCNFMYE